MILTMDGVILSMIPTTLQEGGHPLDGLIDFLAKGKASSALPTMQMC